MEKINTVTNSELGKKTQYVDKYTTDVLYPIPRTISHTNPHGYDLWHLYELSWLDNHGKPEVAIGNLVYESNSEFLIESKSLKLYLNSFNNSRFESRESVKKTIESDLSSALKTDVLVQIFSLDKEYTIVQPKGICIDNIEISEPKFGLDQKVELVESSEIVSEKLYSNLLRSNCPVTGQPDWGTITIEYSGKKISYKRLLELIIAYRNHNDFHEHCVESIYEAIVGDCDQLTVFANYTRRGGIDINPYRSSKRNFELHEVALDRTRIARQ